ncbi:F-box domain-containing protein [Caenorhabditis elegans]|uniref:F-box domain-containing protein n=1 Tax=Caenorhabditis elegans TaxID=6239 RepID=O45576_CAEEL|nr:F-box domain-containing protein [Caenorhabditis elegans]CAB05745.1 F-box domain-containing protein [Caenorhabditis elegans]|eukprot:NP_499733.1 Uncharacterized protein CELE_F56A8.5 [Caenorhabditis elegans]
MERTLLNLPELSLAKIVAYLGPNATINFALSSPIVREFIKTLNLYVEFFSVEINNNRCVIRLKFFYSKKEFEWKFVPPTSCHHRTIIRKLNRKTALCQNPLKEMMKAAEWVTELIRFPISNVHIWGPDFEGSADLFDWSAIQQCEGISMNLISTMNGNLENFKDLEHLELSGCSWFRAEHFRALEANRVSLYCLNFTVQDVNTILRDWTRGSNAKLENLIVHSKEIDGRVPGQILEGLDVKPWNHEQRQKIFPKEEPFQSLNCEKAMDFERADGLLASVIINDNEVEMVVWHKRFSDQEPMEED